MEQEGMSDKLPDLYLPPGRKWVIPIDAPLCRFCKGTGQTKSALGSSAVCPDCEGSGKDGPAFRQISTEREGRRLKGDEVPSAPARAELQRQGAIECVKRRFYPMEGIREINVPQPDEEDWRGRRVFHKHTVQNGNEGTYLELDCPPCSTYLLRECVDDPEALKGSAVPGIGGRANVLRERRRSGAYSWALSPSARPESPAQREARVEAELTEQDRRDRTAASLFS
jgi:hypothetical protein